MNFSDLTLHDSSIAGAVPCLACKNLLHIHKRLPRYIGPKVVSCSSMKGLKPDSCTVSYKKWKKSGGLSVYVTVHDKI